MRVYREKLESHHEEIAWLIELYCVPQREKLKTVFFYHSESFWKMDGKNFKVKCLLMFFLIKIVQALNSLCIMYIL